MNDQFTKNPFFDNINAVKKKLLESFANDCDSSAVHLKAADMHRQGLIRFPHGGIFEIPELTVNIPELTVNNKNKDETI